MYQFSPSCSTASIEYLNGAFRAGRKAQRHKLAFDVLSDPGNRVASEFGLTFKLPEDLRQVYGKFGIDLNKYNGDESWTLPMPARLVIDSSGTVRAVDVDPDYTMRPEPAETVRALEALRSR